MNIGVLKTVKKLLSIVLILVLVLSLTACAEDETEQLPAPTEQFFVNDFAAVLTAEDSTSIYNMGAALASATTAQAVVVTVDSLNGKESSEYALELGRAWGVGDKDKNNGVVILLSEGDRDIYVSVGYGLEGALPDSKVGRIIDNYGIPYFTNDNFSAGIMSVYNTVVNEIYIEYGLPPQENYVPVDMLPSTDEIEASLGEVALSWLVLIVLVALYTLIFGRRGGMFIFGSPRFFTGGFHNNFRGGGFGGFSGGGGSFGGGGAGRKF